VRREIEPELLGIWAQLTKQEALTQLAAFKAKYSQLYPEAVCSLAEEEDKTLTFYDLTRDDAPLHLHHQRHREPGKSMFVNAISQIDVFTRRVELPHDHLGHHRGHSTREKSRSHNIDWVAAKEGAAQNRTSITNQPPGVGKVEMGFFAPLLGISINTTGLSLSNNGLIS
jgi:hypothetical protein